MGTLLLIFVMIFVVAPIAKAYADRLARGPTQEPTIDPTELAQLREELDRLGAEVLRLRDEHSFMVRLLGEGERQKSQENQIDP